MSFFNQLTVTVYLEQVSGSASVWRASYDPSDFSQGISKNGSIKFAGEYTYEINCFLLDAPYGSHTGTLGEYGGSIGETVTLADAFPGVDLVGKYLYINMGSGACVEIVEPYTECYWGTDATCAVNGTLSTENVMLSWSGAQPGTSNAITGYDVQRAESTDGKTWGSWEDVPDSPASEASLSVAPPTTAGNYYKYRVRIRGAAGSDYYSGWKESTNTLRRDHAALAGFTDSTLTAGTSLIKAVHMTELQDRVNTLRTFYGLSKYSFTTITAGTTSLAGWTNHVNQIRTAIEEVCTASGKTHEDWISFSVNCPRADVIQQLRDVVLAL